MATLEEKIKTQVEALLKPTLDKIADEIRNHTGETKLIPFTYMADVIKTQLQKRGSESGGDVVVDINGVFEEGDTIRINFAGVSEGVANAMLQYSFAKATIDQTIDSTIEFTQDNSDARIVYKGTNANIDLTNALGNIDITIDENLPPNVTATGLDHTKILYPHKILGVEGTCMYIDPSGTLPITIERGVENMEVDVRKYDKVSITTNIGTNLPTYEGYAVLHNVEVNPEAVFFPAEAGSYMAGFWVPPVTKEIDGNIRPENIRYGVSILGEIGSYQGFADVEQEGTAINPTSTIDNIYFNTYADNETIVNELHKLDLTIGGMYYVCANEDLSSFISITRVAQIGYVITIKDKNNTTQAYGYADNSSYIGFFLKTYKFKNHFTSVSSIAGTSTIIGNKNELIKQVISQTSYRIEMDWESVTINPREDLQVITPTTGKAINEVVVNPIKAENISYKYNLVTYPKLTPDVIKHDVEVLGIVGTYYGDNLSTIIPEITSNGRHDVARYEYIDVNVPMGYTGVTSDGRGALNINNTEGQFQNISIKTGETSTSLENVQLLVKGTGVLFDNEVDNSTISVNGSGNNLSIIDNDSLTGSIQADSANLDLVLGDSELDLSYCNSEVVITDNFTNKHTIIANNLESQYIKQGITILGVEGSFAGEQASGTITITENGSYSVASYANVIVQVPTEGITGVSSNSSTIYIDMTKTTQSTTQFKYIYNNHTIDVGNSNAKTKVNMRGNESAIRFYDANCNGEHIITTENRNVILKFEYGELKSIKVDGVEV